jgi:hypothetical protein
MDRRIDRGQTTRQRLVDSGMRLFAEHGYEGTSIEMVEARVAAVVSNAAAPISEPLDALRAGCDAWLQLAANDATVRRIVLIDAPTVVGWAAWREIDDRYALGLLKSALARAASAGRLSPDKVDVYAHLLLATLVEAALLIARNNNPTATIRLTQNAIGNILSALIT